MIYFSEIVNKKVVTEDQVDIGQLTDFIFVASDKPTITKMIIKGTQNEHFIVPTEYLSKLNGSVVIRKNYQTSELAENELMVLKNLLDKQIIDLSGNKVVRVNDVVIQDKPSLLVSGVDIGYLAILRWIGIERFFTWLFKRIGMRLTPRLLSWGDIQPLELARGKVKLKREEEKLEKVRPEDLADHLERINFSNVRNILNILDQEFAAEVIGNLNINYQTALFKQFSAEKAAQLITLIDPDDAVDILLTLHKHKREQIIELVPDETKSQIMYLLNLSKTPIGELITSEFVLFQSSMTVEQAINLIKKETPDFSYFEYLYIVNSSNQLVGVCNMHELMLQNLDTPLYKFMIQNVIVIHLSTPKEIAISKMFKYKIHAIPVIDSNKHMLGIITLDDVGDRIVELLK